MKLIVMVLLVSSCASILNDKTQKINVTTSNNKKTDIVINGQQFTAPAIVELARSESDALITVKNSDCTPQYLLKSKVDNKFWINILSLGAFGSTTDYSTEKMWAYDDNVDLKCK